MRKALVVAKKLGVAEFQKWIELETQGYKVGDQVPEYRVIRGEIRAWNPYHGWIDTVMSNPEVQENLSSRPIGQPIGEIETLVQRSTDSYLHVPFRPQLEHDLMMAGEVPLKSTLHVSIAAVKGILDNARNAVLNWCLDLEARGILGQGMTFSAREKQAASAANYHVHFHGPVTTSQIQQGSIHSSQTISSEIDINRLLDFLTDLRDRMPELSLRAELERQMAADVASVEAQLTAPQPKRSIIAECLSSVRNVLEGCVGSLIASGLLQQLSTIWPR
jgi:hypothetical protein